MHTRTPILVVAPTLQDFGGTESIFATEWAALRRDRPALMLPRAATAQHQVDYPVAAPPGPEPFATELWLRAATRRVRAVATAYPIRYAPGLNALDLTHVTVHCHFGEWADLLAALPRPHWRDRIRRVRFQRLNAWEHRLYEAPRLRVAVLSRRAATTLSNAHGTRDISVLPPMLDRRRFRPERRQRLRAAARAALGCDARTQLVLVVGNHWWLKGIDIAAAAVAAMPKDTRLCVVSADRPGLLRHPTPAHPADLMWRRPHRGIANLYAAADVVLLPSRGETLGLPPLEAAAMDTPALVSPHCGATEYLAPAAVVDPNQPDAWAARVQALRAPAARQQLVAANRTAVAPLFWPRAHAFRRWLTAEAA